MESRTPPVSESAIEATAVVCHEANRAYCDVVMNDQSQKPWNEAPLWQRDSARMGVRGIASGAITRPEQSHESWMAEKVAAGWVYGPVKDEAKKEHPCLVPYADLPGLQRKKDDLFLAVAQAMLGMGKFTALELDPTVEPILRFFAFDHLKAPLRAVSASFAVQASVIMQLPRSAERTVALRKLLEAKDAAVRAAL